MTYRLLESREEVAPGAIESKTPSSRQSVEEMGAGDSPHVPVGEGARCAPGYALDAAVFVDGASSQAVPLTPNGECSMRCPTTRSARIGGGHGAWCLTLRGTDRLGRYRPCFDAPEWNSRVASKPPFRPCQGALRLLRFASALRVTSPSLRLCSGDGGKVTFPPTHATGTVTTRAESQAQRAPPPNAGRRWAQGSSSKSVLDTGVHIGGARFIAPTCCGSSPGAGVRFMASLPEGPANQCPPM